MTRKATKRNGTSAARLKKLRDDIAELEQRLAKAKADFEATEEFDLNDAAPLLEMLVKRVVANGERLYLTRGKKRLVALVPADEAEFLSEWEDRHDVEQARRAINEPSIPWDEVKKELQL
jgi:hypothetical protein